MSDHDQTKAELIAELAQARDQIAALEAALAEHKRSGKEALERAIAEVKATVLKSFLGSMSGFVTTPLTVIKASVMTLRSIPAEDVQAEQWRVLDAQVGYLERLFENMLLMIRLDNLAELDRAPTSWNRLVQQVVDRYKPLADQRTHTLIFQPEAGSARVLADNYLIKSALGAVVNNAVDFTPRGGRITIKAHAHQGYAIATIRDNGIGIDPDDLPHIFKRFWWANRADYPNPGSVGLGLALAERIIDLHEGRIDVESVRDEGSTFWVSLPVV
ncbi:MAG: HAMP domain-containing histidine kinase [Anaerolineae bacterium]|nr:HAMP domain-containing histidine kinase [Anaerolineae bacterium]